MFFKSKMNSIIDNYINAIKNKYNLSDSEAFEVLPPAIILDKTFDEVYSNIWIGGNDDCGFDAVYIDDTNNSIFLFQSKNVSNLKENEVMKMQTDFEDLFVQDNASNRTINSKLQFYLNEYKQYTRDGVILKPELFFIYNGDNSDTQSSNNRIFNQFSFSYRNGIKIKIIDSVELCSRIANFQKTGRRPVSFTFQPLDTNIPTYNNQAIFTFSIGQTTCASFRIEALELCKLIEKEISVNDFMDTLFHENIRGYLGNNKTNKRITKTLKDKEHSKFFPFMNNGITVICENIEIPSNPQAKIYNINVKNPIIVNGLQTTRVIYNVFLENEELLKDVYVTLKLYESTNNELIELITEATNTQTAINYRDQISNKFFNDKAHLHFAARKINYVYKKGAIVRNNDLGAGLKDSVNNDMVLKFWYATYMKNPHVAKISKNSVLENVFLATKGEGPLKDVFAGDISLLCGQLYNAYLIYKFIVSKRIENAEKEGMDYLLHADEIISYGMYLYLEDREKKEFSEILLKDAYDFANTIVQDIVKCESEFRGETYSHTKYFKNENIVEDYDKKIKENEDN